MVFRQLYYTSCERGLSGYAGFQFNAVTPGVSPITMREIEQLTVYEPPRPPSDEDDPADQPVNLMHTVSSNDDSLITARVCFAGTDFSHRPGNYFVHALLNTEGWQDFGDVLPIELWDAPFWTAQAVDDPQLPALPAPPARGPLTRRQVALFLAGRPQARLLPSLLSAVYERMTTAAPPVVIVAATTADIAHWIAALSYLLGPDLVTQLTFSTYHRRPSFAMTHVVGTLPAAMTTITGGLRVFDLAEEIAGGELPTGGTDRTPVHPAARLLARVGVERAAELWDRAIRLGDGASSSLMACYPMLAVVDLAQGGAGDPEETAAAIEWLATSESGREYAGDVLRALLARPLDGLTFRRQRQLLELAGWVDPDLAEIIERSLVAAAAHRMETGRPAGPIVALTTASGRRAAQEVCLPILVDQAAESVRLLDTMGWAAAAGVEVPAKAHVQIAKDLVNRLRFQRIEPTLIPRLAEALRGWPEMCRVLLDELARLPRPEAILMLESIPPDVFEDSELARHSGLAQDWLLKAAMEGRLSRVTVFHRLFLLREGRSTSLETLISTLWPRRPWTRQEAAELLRLLPPLAWQESALHERLVAVLQDPPRSSDDDGPWVDLLRALVDHPTATAIPGLSAAARVLDRTGWVQRAESGTPPGQRSFLGLYTAYPNEDPAVQRLLHRRLPGIMLRADPVEVSLDTCPQRLFSALCSHVTRLLAETADHRTAAWMFVAMRELRLAGAARSQILDKEILQPSVSAWGTRDFRAMEKAVSQLSPRRAGDLRIWLPTRKSGGSSLSRLFRGGPFGRR